MAIQFRCPGCSQPIEVDDVNAGQTAACPYCRRVVKVPTESTLDRESPTVARPTDAGERGDVAAPDSANTSAPRTIPPPPATPEALHLGAAVSNRDQAARTYGNYALICTALAVLLLVGTVVYGATLLADELKRSGASQPSLEQVSENLAVQHPGLAVGPLGAMFFAVVGLALGITSVKQTTQGNWRGIASVVLCGLFIVCFCGINALALLAGGLGAPAWIV